MADSQEQEQQVFLDALYREMKWKLLYYARRHLNDPQQAEDADGHSKDSAHHDRRNKRDMYLLHVFAAEMTGGHHSETVGDPHEKPNEKSIHH